MKITANMVTMARIVLMPVPGILLYGDAGQLTIALAAIIILGLTDWVDGIMARKEGPSVLGGLLDPIADKIFIAVIYLPLTERGIIPLWMTAAIFARDFLVTALRTSLMLRNAPMRTSTLAKFKTGMQMVGIGYVVLYLAFAEDPSAIWVWLITITPIGLPLGLMIYRLIKGQKQGLRSSVLMVLMTVAVVMRIVLGPDGATIVTIYIVTAMTIISGVSYMVDAWSALRGRSGSVKEALRFFLEGLLMPVAFVLVLGRYDIFGVSALVIWSVTLELAVGGLGNLLASKQIASRFRWIAIKSILQVCLCGGAFLLWQLAHPQADQFGPILVAVAAGITTVYTIIAFWRHRQVYLKAI